jgi:hypothetical protein
MRRSVFAIAVGGLALAACQPASMTRQEIAVQEQALQARVAAWAKAFSNQQRDSLATYYEQSDQLTVAWPDGDRSNSWDEEAAKQTEFFAQAQQLNLVLQDPQVEILNARVALTTFRHAMDVIVGDVNPERRYFTGQGTLVWLRADDSSPWLIRAAQMSETPQPAAAPPARRR